MAIRTATKTSLIRHNDSLAREINLRLHHNRCTRCGRSGDVYKLDWSHVFGRQAKCIRWDEMNALAMCFLCHSAWHDNPLEAAEWFNQKYPGRRKYLQDKLNEAKPMKLKDYREINDKLKKRLDELSIQ